MEGSYAAICAASLGSFALLVRRELNFPALSSQGFEEDSLLGKKKGNKVLECRVMWCFRYGMAGNLKCLFMATALEARGFIFFTSHFLIIQMEKVRYERAVMDSVN